MATAELDVLVDIRDAVKNLNEFQSQAQKTSKETSSAFEGLKKVAAAATAVFAAKQVVDFFQAGIEAAVAQETAMTALGQSLKLTGEFSEQALDQFAAFADQMEATTTHGDDVILSQLAVAKSFGVTNEEAQKLVEAAVELSAATGKDLQTSVQSLGATFSGTAGKLEKTVPALAGLSKEALKAGDAVDVILERFGGSAAAQLETFAGATTQAQNAFGNLQESFGKIVVENAAVIATIQGVRAVFAELQKIVEDNEEALSSLVTNGMKVFAVTAGATIEAIGYLVDGFRVLVVGTQLAVSTLVDVGAGLAEAFAMDDTAKDLNAFRDSMLETAAATDQGFEKFRGGYDRFAKVVDDAAQKVFDADEKVTAKVKDAVAARKEFARIPSIDPEQAAKDRDAAIKLSTEITNAALTDIQKVVAKRDEYYAKVAELEAKGALSAQQATNLRVSAEETAISKLVEIREKMDSAAIEASTKAAQEAAERMRATIEAVAAKPFEFAAKVALDFESFDQKKLVAFGAGVLNRMLEGAAGAKSAISELGAGIADAFLPGIGGAVGGILSKLAEGPEATEAFIRDFIAAVPDIIVAIAESIPVVVEALVDSLINEGGILRIAQALGRALLGEGLFKALGKQLGIEVGDAFNADKIGETLANGLQRGAHAVGEAINAAFDAVGAFFKDGFKNLINAGWKEVTDFFKGFAIPPIPTPQFIEDLAATVTRLTTNPAWVDTFDRIVKKLTDWDFPDPFGVTGGGGGGGVGGAAGGVGGALNPENWFARGITEIPRGYPNDSYIAGLTSGERVVDAGTNEDLKAFLANGGMGGGSAALLERIAMALEVGQSVPIQLTLDGKVLASAIVDLKRRNARLA